MTRVTRTLLLIAAFVALSLGSFIWYIATWNPQERAPSSFLLRENTSGSGAEPRFPPRPCRSA